MSFDPPTSPLVGSPLKALISHPLQFFLQWRRTQTPPSLAATQPWRWFLPFLIVVPMLGIAGALHKTTVIFPEGAALAFGVFVLVIPGWTVSRWRLMVVLPIAALYGVGLAYLSIPFALEMIAGISGVLILLHFIRSMLAPSISATLIPIVFHIHSWFYPATVIGVSIAITLIGSMLARTAPQAPTPSLLSLRRSVSVKFWIISVVWILIVTTLHLPKVMLAPPLFVSTYEIAGASTSFKLQLSRATIFGVLGFLGVALLAIASSDEIAGLATFTIGLVYMAIARRYHPPILSIALLALIAGPIVDWKFGLYLAIGSLGLYFLNSVFDLSTKQIKFFQRNGSSVS